MLPSDVPVAACPVVSGPAATAAVATVGTTAGSEPTTTGGGAVGGEGAAVKTKMLSEPWLLTSTCN